MHSEKLNKKELVDLHGEDYVAKFESNRSIYQKRLKGILKHINLDKTISVVDYGCGNGQLFELINKDISSYAGVDFSQSFIDAFQKKLKEANFETQPKLYCQDIVEFVKTNQAAFDLAFTLDFSEHIYDEDFIEIYKAIFSSLKNDGKLVLHTPNGNFFLEWMRNNGIIKQRDEHIAVRNARQYLPLLKKVGFSKIEIKHIPHYNILKHLHLLSYIPLIGGTFKARLLLICYKFRS